MGAGLDRFLLSVVLPRSEVVRLAVGLMFLGFRVVSIDGPVVAGAVRLRADAAFFGPEGVQLAGEGVRTGVQRRAFALQLLTGALEPPHFFARQRQSLSSANSASKVREQVKKAKLRLSGDAVEALSKAVGDLISKAGARAKANKRQTIKASDI